MPFAFASARKIGIVVALAACANQGGCKDKAASRSATPQDRSEKAVEPPPTASTMARELAELSGFLEFVESHDGKSRLRRMRPAGDLLVDEGERADLFPAAGPISVAITAPNRDDAPEQLVLVESSEVRALGDAAPQIRNVVVASGAGFAIYESNENSFRDLYRAELSTGKARRLTEDGDGAFDPDLSPDDGFVVFVTTAPGQADLHLMSADGKERRALTETRFNETSPAWSPDGASIAFSSDAEGPERVFVIPAGGGPPHRLTSQGSPDEHEVEPLWSPRGDRVAYFQHSSKGRTELWVSTWPSGKAWRVSADDGYAKQAQWSPDGRFLWYSDDTDDNVDIWAARSDGSERLRLSKGEREEWLPRFRPAP